MQRELGNFIATHLQGQQAASEEERAFLEITVQRLANIEDQCQQLRAAYQQQCQHLASTLSFNERMERENALLRQSDSLYDHVAMKQLSLADAKPMPGAIPPGSLVFVAPAPPPMAGLSAALLNMAKYQFEKELPSQPEQEEKEVAVPPPVQLPLQLQNPAANATTVMVQNVPMGVTRDGLIDIWPPQGSYDFLYLPFNVKRRRIAGYAFVSFVSTAAAEAFTQEWAGRRLPGRETVGKPLAVLPAECQGCAENLRHFRRTAWVNNDKYWPAVFDPDSGARLDIYEALAGLGDVGEDTASVVDADN